jgi:hypothetical protein
MTRTLLSILLIAALTGCNQEKSFYSIVDTPETFKESSCYISTRDPLQPFPLLQLPLGSINAGGWLQTQLDLMTEGYTGHLYEISQFLTEESGWLGGEERGWEEAPYWFRGFYDLSVLTENERIDSVANRWIEAVIGSLDEDGYYGSAYNKMVVSSSGTDSLADLWPHMVMNDVLISHYEATGDERIIPMLTKFFTYCRGLSDEEFLPQVSWDYYENYRELFGDWKPRIQLKRAGDLVPHIYWLYNRTGEEWLLDLALRAYQKTQPPMNQWMDNHVVHFMQRFRYPAQMYPLTHDSFYLENSRYYYEQMMNTWGHSPRGVFAADERIRNGKVDPRQGYESCGIVEGNKSFIILGDMTGNPEFADKIEDLTFNWLPASHTPDLKGLRYIFAANMPSSVPNMDYHNSGPHPVFAASMHRCCQHNTAMGWPWFTRNMWKASPDNGLVAWLYGPNEVTAKVGNSAVEVQVTSTTSYPFTDLINFKLKLQENASFPLYLRIPGWANDMNLSINNQNAGIINQQGQFIKIDREWSNGDEVSIDFKPEISLTEWPRTKSVTVDRGPLSYSVRIKENWEEYEADQSGWDRFTILPASDWNYGLPVESINLTKDIKVSMNDEMPDQPWTEENVPLVLSVPAKKIPGWEAAVRNTVDPLREGPIRSDEPIEMIEMIPMGAAHLRMTCLPVISDSKNARYWEDIPDPNVFMLERLTR